MFTSLGSSQSARVTEGAEGGTVRPHPPASLPGAVINGCAQQALSFQGPGYTQETPALPLPFPDYLPGESPGLLPSNPHGARILSLEGRRPGHWRLPATPGISIPQLAHPPQSSLLFYPHTNRICVFIEFVPHQIASGDFLISSLLKLVLWLCSDLMVVKNIL